MKNILLALIVLLLPGLWRAEETDYPGLIDKTVRYLTVFADDRDEQLNLAYYYMLNAQPDSALAWYQRLLEADAFPEQAAGGTLWALNSLGRYPETISTARSMIRLYPANPDLRNHRALAYLRSESPLRARTDYRKALKLSSSASLPREIAIDGLAWSYNSLGDVAKARRILAPTDPEAHPEIRAELKKPRFNLSVGMGFKDNSDTYYLVVGNGRWRTWALGLAAEEYRLAGAHYRTSAALTLGKQFAPLEISLSSRGFSGTDEMIYPAWQAGAGVSSRILLPNSFLAPRLAANYGYYQSFSSLQADVGCWAGTDRIKVNFNYSELRLDNEAPDADTGGKVYSAALDLRLWQAVHLTGNVASGDLEWWTNPNGVVIDTFETNDTVCGVGLLLPLGKVFSLHIYQQLGIFNDEYNYLGQGQILVRL